MLSTVFFRCSMPFLLSRHMDKSLFLRGIQCVAVGLVNEEKTVA